MPLRSSSMELSDPVTPDTSVEMDGAANLRKSGRAKYKPVLLNKDPNIPQSTISNGKRKRSDTRVDGDNDSSEMDEEESDADESDPDEEELKEKRRKAAQAKKPPSRPAAKKAKSGPGMNTNLAVRPAVNGVKRPTKPKQPRARPVKNRADDGTGLYGKSSLYIHIRLC